MANRNSLREVTRYDQGSIFIQTHTPDFFFRSESPTDSDLVAHGSLHAFGLATGQNGYWNNRLGTLAAESAVTDTLNKLKNGFAPPPHLFNYSDAERIKKAFFDSGIPQILRDGARKYAIGSKSR